MPKKTEVVTDLPEPEQASEFIEVPFRDGFVQVPRARGKWPTRAIMAFNRHENLKAVEIALGPAQWDLVVDSEIDEFEKFCETFADMVLNKVFEN